MATDMRKKFELSGKVIRGEFVGRKLGYPTINVSGHHDLPYGVYVSIVTTSKGRFRGALHFGPRGTFGGEHPVLEVHLLDFRGDLYDETVCVDVYNRLRDIQAFKDLSALKEQIEKDIEQVALADVPLQ
ncbi:riboflavin kinase [Patescibacteria group bacterium]|nr:riboflavin kinase [Patescibacteria group bacterium]MBU1703275.1 riboflavin kinase [Patescibacteria group bacterium]MBU1954394.1 riboflavin kinase [Patescibacteria group bacterium]